MTETDFPQAMRPHGLVGRLFAAAMERMNEKAYLWTVAQLEARKPQSLFELGFGTGRCLELAAERLPLQNMAGVDPSELMLDQARTRLKRIKRKIAINLRLGDDTSNVWSEQRFDAIVALHSFQFWANPASTLEMLRRQLAPDGRLVLVLRRHDKRKPDWLPNPISRSADEVSGTKAALAEAGFTVVRDEGLDSGSHGLVSR